MMKHKKKQKFPSSLFHDHTTEAISDRLGKKRKKSMIRDFVYGSIDGAITTFSIVAGVKGADLSTMTILVLGLSNIVSDGFSMAASNYLGTKADLDEQKMLKEFEHIQIASDPEGERKEVVEIYRQKGFEGELLEKVVNVVVSDRQRWIETMMTEEYGHSSEVASPVLSGAMTFIAFIAFGMLPLIPYIFNIENAFTWATCLTGFSFFLLGTLKSKWSLENGWISGLKTFLIGSVAASLAYGVGVLFN